MSIRKSELISPPGHDRRDEAGRAMAEKYGSCQKDASTFPLKDAGTPSTKAYSRATAKETDSGSRQRIRSEDAISRYLPTGRKV